MIGSVRTKLGDFTTNPRRLALMSMFTAVIGVVSAFVAKFLLLLIGLITHVAYYGNVRGGLIRRIPAISVSFRF